MLLHKIVLFTFAFCPGCYSQEKPLTENLYNFNAPPAVALQKQGCNVEGYVTPVCSDCISDKEQVGKNVNRMVEEEMLPCRETFAYLDSPRARVAV